MVFALRIAATAAPPRRRFRRLPGVSMSICPKYSLCVSDKYPIGNSRSEALSVKPVRRCLPARLTLPLIPYKA